MIHKHFYLFHFSFVLPPQIYNYILPLFVLLLILMLTQQHTYSSSFSSSNFTTTCLFLVTWRGDGLLSACSGFLCKPNCRLCIPQTVGGRPTKKHQLSSKCLFPDGRSKDRGVSGETCPAPPWLGDRNSPAERRRKKKKHGRRIEYILSQQLSLPSHLHFPNCKFFLCKYFLLKPLEKSFTHGVKYILSNVNQEAINTVLRTR